MMYGNSVPVTKLMDPKTKEEFTVNDSDVAQWLELGYVTVGGTAPKGGKASKAVVSEEADSE
jgi:hypothetical protein